MIEVRAPLELGADPQGGWQLVFYVLDAFDFATPFRAMHSDIAGALGQDPLIDLQLPAWRPHEDFVEGTLRFGPLLLRVYYEHSLSYLAIMSDREAVLCDVAARLRPHVALVA